MNESIRFKTNRGDRMPENQSSVQLYDADISKINLQRALLRRQEALERLVTENKILERKLQRQAARRRSAAEDAESCDSNRVVTYHRYQHDYPRELAARHAPAVPAITTPSYVVDISSLMQQQQQQPHQPNYQQSPNIKSGVIDMMMMQNAQMNQLLMHKLMLASVPKPRTESPAVAPRRNDVIPKAADVIELLRGSQRKPQAVHHHHYNTAPPPVQMVQLPPLQPKKPPMVCCSHHSVAKSPRCCCHDDEIMKPMRYWSPAPSNNSVLPERKLPRTRPRNYGSNSTFMRRFRRAAYVVLFTKIMQGRNARLLFALRNPVLTDELMARIRIRECVSVIHNNFTARPGRVAGILKPLINDTAIDLTAAIADNSSREEEEAAIKSLATVLENIVYFMTDIMPSSGVLGTNAKALLYHILQPGHVFPVGYFWAVEKEILKTDNRDRPTALDDSDAHIVLIGLFLGRALIRTTLATPEKYGIVSRVGHRARQNLRLISSLFTYLLRRLYVLPKSTILATPAELSVSMYTDDELKALIKRLKTSFEYSEKILRDWSREYIKRTRAVGQPQRT